MDIDGELFTCFESSSSKRKVEIEDIGNPLSKQTKRSPNDSIHLYQNSDEDLTSILAKHNEIVIRDVPCDLTCLHQVAVNSSLPFEPIIPTIANPAREFPFVLDSFQKQAIMCVESNQSVLVSAHTSSGKTVVAEYAIAKCVQNHQRVIYTSPIKALSNQKYRELNEVFNDVGLQTGDVTLRPNASCIVMTTEILRNMLYRGSEIIREVAWVIFDEIHYMRDKERGVVWEETIILLPDSVRYVFLSATVPNACQFAEWICLTHNQPCHFITTDFRPTPLQHYVFPSQGDSIYLIVDDKGSFKDANLQKIYKSNNADRNKSISQNIIKLAKSMVERAFTPVIVFSFSKKECEHYALNLSVLDFTNDREKLMIEEVFFNAIDNLSDEDKKLPQVRSSLPILKRGIGIHHSGLLPIVKEVTEILFGEGLLKFLFSTETFAMGLNMPARTVVFTSYKKYDGVSSRPLQSGEYIQMSGRAGRRGIDDRGICILMVDENVDSSSLKSIYRGVSDPLNSAFRLTYNMILNLLRIDGIDPEYMMKKSFFQYQINSKIPLLVDKLQSLIKQHDEFVVLQSESLTEYLNNLNEYNRIKAKIIPRIVDSNKIKPYIHPGRVVRVQSGTQDFGYGCILDYGDERVTTTSKTGFTSVLINCIIETNTISESKYRPSFNSDNPDIIPVAFSFLSEITAIRLCLPGELNTKDARMSVLNSIRIIKDKFPNGIPLIDPIKDMKINDSEFVELYKEYQTIFDSVKNSRIGKKIQRGSKKYDEMIKNYQDKLNIKNDIDLATYELEQTKSIVKLDDLKARKKILRRLGFIDANDAIDVKGRVACEISSADELVLTELIFNGFFNDLTPQSICGILSCFLYQERSFNGNETLSDSNQKLISKLMETVKRVCSIMEECNLIFDPTMYKNSFKTELVEVFYNWANGASFGAVLELSEVFEGSVIRCLRRLDELLKQLILAAKCIGNSELETKFKQASQKIKRNVAFSASLYL